MKERLKTDSPPPLEPHGSAAAGDPLDALLRRGLSEQLDMHIGRAAERFLAESDRPALTAPSGSAMRLWWAVPLLAAAAVVAMFAAPVFRAAQSSPADPSIASQRATNPGHLPSHGADASLTQVRYEPTEVGGAVKWADQYEGMVWLDDETPAQKIRRHRLETLEWTDPLDSSRIQITLPREEIVLVSSPKL